MDTIVDSLYSFGNYIPAQPAYIFLDKNADEVQRLTYADLLSKAELVAAGLVSQQGANLKKGARVLLDFSTDMDFAVALWGCLVADCVVVPVASARSQADTRRLQTIVNDIAPQLILYSARREEFWRSQSALFADIPTLCFDKLLEISVTTENGEKISASEINAQDAQCHPSAKLALVQYTSGTTGIPKGVCITHTNLLANACYLQEHFALRQGEILVSWLPHFHDMGLIGKFIQTIFMGGTLVFMEPLSFLARPINWFIAINRYRAVGTAAPNFAYDHCVDRIHEEDMAGLDLSSLRFACNGSEVVRQSSLERFSKRFSSVGLHPNAISPTYGMAETTLFISGKSYKEHYAAVAAIQISQSESRLLVPHGRKSPLHITIVNPETLQVCGVEQVGEIWLKGDNVSPGYWCREQLNQSLFHAHTAEGDGPYFRTGDLGILNAEGVLFIAGRLKDLIIVRGKNFFPQDIESSAESVDNQLRAGYSAAFSVDINGHEKAILLHEIAKPVRENFNQQELIARIHFKVSAELALDVDTIGFVRQGSLPTTSSGKIQRSLCRDKYLNGELALLR